MANLHSITVGELIKILQHEDESAMVVIGVNYGDRGRTLQAIPLRGECEEVAVGETSYSESGYKIDDEACGADDDYDDSVTYLRIR